MATAEAHAGRLERARRLWWLVFALNPFWSAWASLLYAGLRAKNRRWLAFGVLYFAVAVFGIVFIDDGGGVLQDLAGIATFAGWLVALGHSIAIRNAYLERMDILDDPRLERARHAALERELALELARDQPQLAADSGLAVDLNHADAQTLATLPGVDAQLAEQIVRIRERVDGFSSVYDLGSLLDLPADLVDGIKDRVVCLPR